MNYEICAKKRGIGYVVWGSAFLVILIGINYMAYFSQGAGHPPLFFMAILNILWFLFSWAMVSTGKKQIKKGGSWTVRVDELGFLWNSPNYNQGDSIDQSFNYSLEEIDYIETFRSKTGRGGSYSRGSHYVHLENGKIRKIRTNSGINVNRIFNELEKLGVPHVDSWGDATKPDIDDLCIA